MPTITKGLCRRTGLAETFATLTRLPITPMFHPNELTASLQDDCGPLRSCVSGQADYLAHYRQQRIRIAGGIIYDALHVRCAEKARCDRIYTFNIPEQARCTRLKANLLPNQVVSTA